MKLDFASLTSLEPALLRRCPENPILTTEDIPYSCKRVYNPAATRLNGRYALVIRVDSHEGEQMLGLALSDDRGTGADIAAGRFGMRTPE